MTDVLGGRKGALDASTPPLAFVVGWLAGGQSVAIGAGAALAVSVLVGVFRLIRGGKLGALLVSVAIVAAGALIALHTGHAEDFFLVRLLSNVASALMWTASIAVRWPLLGVVVGTVLGQKTQWRRDPDLLRAYSRASWVWVLLQYTVRVAVWTVLWAMGQVVALGVFSVLLSWPLVAATVAASSVVFFRSLPDDHPGIRHPRVEPRPDTAISTS